MSASNVPYWEDPCDVCGEVAITATRCMPQKRTCKNGHTWTRPFIKAVKEVPKDKTELKVQLAAINMKLMMATSGACSCLTKTPDPSFHKPHCSYRNIREAMILVDDLWNAE